MLSNDVLQWYVNIFVLEYFNIGTGLKVFYIFLSNIFNVEPLSINMFISLLFIVNFLSVDLCFILNIYKLHHHFHHLMNYFSFTPCNDSSIFLLCFVDCSIIFPVVVLFLMLNLILAIIEFLILSIYMCVWLDL